MASPWDPRDKLKVTLLTFAHGATPAAVVTIATTGLLSISNPKQLVAKDMHCPIPIVSANNHTKGKFQATTAYAQLGSVNNMMFTMVLPGYQYRHKS